MNCFGRVKPMILDHTNKLVKNLVWASRFTTAWQIGGISKRMYCLNLCLNQGWARKCGYLQHNSSLQYGWASNGAKRWWAFLLCHQICCDCFDWGDTARASRSKHSHQSHSKLVVNVRGSVCRFFFGLCYCSHIGSQTILFALTLKFVYVCVSA